MTRPIHWTDPSLQDLQADLTATTERLASELANPAEAAPAWSGSQWKIARAVAAIHGISALLGGGLRWRGPPGWDAFLAEQRSAIAARLSRIQALLGHIETGARKAGLPIIALKGAALHARGLYTPGERPMADIDILVREQEAAQVARLLATLGYREGAATWKHRSFAPVDGCGSVAALGEDAAADIKVEMHTSIREILPVRAVDISSLVLPERLHPGLNDYPSTAALLLHMLLHAAGTMVMRELRLLHLNDIARLCAAMSAQDWDEFFRRGRSTRDPTLWWTYPPLALADRYYHCVPEPLLARVSRACSWHLRHYYRHRRLTDVSFSHVWISAFPGIEWSGSVQEMARYILRRVVPSAETRALRAEFAELQPGVSGGAWARTSQLRRTVRWVLARQGRQATLCAVRASMVRPL